MTINSLFNKNHAMSCEIYFNICVKNERGKTVNC